MAVIVAASKSVATPQTSATTSHGGTGPPAQFAEPDADNSGGFALVRLRRFLLLLRPRQREAPEHRVPECGKADHDHPERGAPWRHSALRRGPESLAREEALREQVREVHQEDQPGEAPRGPAETPRVVERRDREQAPERKRGGRDHFRGVPVLERARNGDRREEQERRRTPEDEPAA